METIFNTLYGSITYYYDHKLACIVQGADKYGVYFYNCSLERLQLTPPNSGIIAVFKIKKYHNHANRK